MLDFHFCVAFWCRAGEEDGILEMLMCQGVGDEKFLKVHSLALTTVFDRCEFLFIM